jgi:hypothetical protein
LPYFGYKYPSYKLFQKLLEWKKNPSPLNTGKDSSKKRKWKENKINEGSDKKSTLLKDFIDYSLQGKESLVEMNDEKNFELLLNLSSQQLETIFQHFKNHGGIIHN